MCLALSPGSNATGGGLCQGLLGVGPYVTSSSFLLLTDVLCRYAGSQIYKTLNNTKFNGVNFLTNVSYVAQFTLGPPADWYGLDLQLSSGRTRVHDVPAVSNQYRCDAGWCDVDRYVVTVVNTAGLT